MSLNNVFGSILPSLDIHGYDRETARVAINDYINDNFKIKRDTFVIIHGFGEGVLRKATKDTLKSNKKVIEFKIDFLNAGSTIVRIKV